MSLLWFLSSSAIDQFSRSMQWASAWLWTRPNSVARSVDSNWCFAFWISSMPLIMWQPLALVCFLDAETWQASEADLGIWGDASVPSLAFWASQLNTALITDPVVDSEHGFNIFNEAVTASLEWATTLQPIPHCLTIHTNLTTSFGIFWVSHHTIVIG